MIEKHIDSILDFICIYTWCVIGAVVALLWMFLASITGSGRARRIALGFDYLLNATFGGEEDKYISSRCWRNREEPHYAALVQIINLAFRDSRHCEKSFIDEQKERMRHASINENAMLCQ